MSRPSPRRVFDDPPSAWSFLTQPNDDEFEGQHFDRKEAGRPVSNGPITRRAPDGVKEPVLKTVSAFAHSNVEGGLPVLGISSTGEMALTERRMFRPHRESQSACSSRGLRTPWERGWTR